MSRLYPGWGSGSKPFVATYKCYPFAYCGREDAEMGNRAVMPQHALRDITRLKLPFPLFFALNPTKKRLQAMNDPPKRGSSNTVPPKKATKRQQYCSVLEFSSEDDNIYVPLWMFKALRIQEGGLVRVDSVLDVPKGQFCQFLVESCDFFTLSQRLGAKALLESALRSYACLSEGSRILVQHANDSYFLKVVQCKPKPLISVLGNVDLEVDFVPPEDYVPSSTPTPSALSSTAVSQQQSNSDDQINELASAFGRSCAFSSEDGNTEDDPAEVREDDSETEAPKGHSLLQTPRNHEPQSGGAGDDGVCTPEEPLSPSRKRCPNCARVVPVAGFQMHEIHCARNYYKCDMCSGIVKNSDRLTHNDECHTVYTCDQCDAQIFEGGKAALALHLESECRARVVKCSYCDERHTFSSMEFHELECGSSLTTCNQGCCESIPRKDLSTHICKTECGKCGEKVELTALEHHESFECLNGERMCDYCSVSQAAENFDKHREYCGNRSDACDTCGAFVRLAQMAEHRASGCQVGGSKPSSAGADRGSPTSLDESIRPALLADTGVLDGHSGPQHLSPPSEVTSCPHCGELCMDLEEFQIHLLTKCAKREESLGGKPTSDPTVSTTAHRHTMAKMSRRAAKASKLTSTKPIAARRSSKATPTGASVSGRSMRNSAQQKPLITRGSSVPFSTKRTPQPKRSSMIALNAKGRSKGSLHQSSGHLKATKGGSGGKTTLETRKANSMRNFVSNHIDVTDENRNRSNESLPRKRLSKRSDSRGSNRAAPSSRWR